MNLISVVNSLYIAKAINFDILNNKDNGNLLDVHHIDVLIIFIQLLTIFAYILA